MVLQPGHAVGPYTITRELGQGGMATVYLARHDKLDRDVAIKVMHDSFRQDVAFLSRFEREAQIVGQLDHPHIVPVYDYSDYEGAPYLVMKYVTGKTLKAILNREDDLSLEEVLRIIGAVADALTYAHERGVLHRDVKPSNIILDDSSTPYLADFGLARITRAGESTISTDMVLGTPQYISPEQAQGAKNIDGRADVYSLGIVLYELIVGHVPFSADSPYAIIHDHIYRAVPRPSEVNTDVTPSVEAVLLKALEKNPEKRFDTPNEMIDALREAIAVDGVEHLSEGRSVAAAQSIAELRMTYSTPAFGGVPQAVESPSTSPRTTFVEPPRYPRRWMLGGCLGFIASFLLCMATFAAWDEAGGVVQENLTQNLMADLQPFGLTADDLDDLRDTLDNDPQQLYDLARSPQSDALLALIATAEVTLDDLTAAQQAVFRAVLARAYIEQGALGRAQQLLDPLVDDPPPIAFVVISELRYAQGDVGRARRALLAAETDERWLLARIDELTEQYTDGRETS